MSPFFAYSHFYESVYSTLRIQGREWGIGKTEKISVLAKSAPRGEAILGMAQLKGERSNRHSFSTTSTSRSRLANLSNAKSNEPGGRRLLKVVENDAFLSRILSEVAHLRSAVVEEIRARKKGQGLLDLRK